VTMRSVTNSMGSVVKGMDKAMESMNLERVSLCLFLYSGMGNVWASSRGPILSTSQGGRWMGVWDCAADIRGSAIGMEAGG